MKEEKILFAALEKHGIPVEGGTIGMMFIEHEEGRGYVRAPSEALEKAAKTRKKEDLFPNFMDTASV